MAKYKLQKKVDNLGNTEDIDISIPVDDTLSTSSENPVQNKVIATKFEDYYNKKLVDDLTNSLDSDITSLNTKVTNLEDEVETNTADIGILNTTVTNNTNIINNLRPEWRVDSATIEDIGGVGTDYTIEKSYFMPVIMPNSVIQPKVGDEVTFATTNATYVGIIKQINTDTLVINVKFDCATLEYVDGKIAGGGVNITATNGLTASKTDKDITISGVTATNSAIGVTKLYKSTESDAYTQNDGATTPLNVKRAIIEDTTTLGNTFNATSDHRGTMSKEDKAKLDKFDTSGTTPKYNNSDLAFKSEIPTKTSQLTNDSSFLTGITSAQVTGALGYTPYNSTNPNGYITKSDLPKETLLWKNANPYTTYSGGTITLSDAYTNYSKLIFEYIPTYYSDETSVRRIEYIVGNKGSLYLSWFMIGGDLSCMMSCRQITFQSGTRITIDGGRTADFINDRVPYVYSDNGRSIPVAIYGVK